jgi:hypothetical protein
VRIDDAQIAGLKRLLRLTDMQERNWPPVEAALRVLARRSSQQAFTRMDVHELLAAALPLLRTLDADQKRSALAFVRRMGLLPAASL